MTVDSCLCIEPDLSITRATWLTLCFLRMSVVTFFSLILCVLFSFSWLVLRGFPLYQLPLTTRSYLPSCSVEPWPCGRLPINGGQGGMHEDRTHGRAGLHRRLGAPGTAAARSRRGRVRPVPAHADGRRRVLLPRRHRESHGGHGTGRPRGRDHSPGGRARHAGDDPESPAVGRDEHPGRPERLRGSRAVPPSGGVRGRGQRLDERSRDRQLHDLEDLRRGLRPHVQRLSGRPRLGSAAGQRVRAGAVRRGAVRALEGPQDPARFHLPGPDRYGDGGLRRRPAGQRLRLRGRRGLLLRHGHGAHDGPRSAGQACRRRSGGVLHRQRRGPAGGPVRRRIERPRSGRDDASSDEAGRGSGCCRTIRHKHAGASGDRRPGLRLPGGGHPAHRRVVRRELAALLEGDPVVDYVIVPLWRRAGFAAACLRRLARAMDGGVRVMLSVACGHDEETLAVAKEFEYAHPGRAVLKVRDIDYPSGSYNVFTTMQEALNWVGPDDLVHVLEEDILIGVGYFGFHRDTHKLAPGAYSVSACENIFLADDVRVPI